MNFEMPNCLVYLQFGQFGRFTKCKLSLTAIATNILPCPFEECRSDVFVKQGLSLLSFDIVKREVPMISYP